MGAAAYAQLYREYPSYAARIDKRRKRQVLRAGQATRAALMMLSQNLDGSPNTAILDALTHGYTQAIHNLDARVADSQKEFLRTIVPKQDLQAFNRDLHLWPTFQEDHVYLPQFHNVEVP